MDELTDFVIGIRFTRLGKIYHFKANDDQDIVIGDSVLVETSRGYQIGTVVQLVEDIAQLDHPNVKSIIRKTNEEDVRAQEEWNRKEEETLRKARECVPRKGENAVKVVHVEYGYLGESISVLVSSISENKVNLFPIRQELEKVFPNTVVNVRQIGPRDVAKLFGGIGACGLPERCCTQFMDGFNSISIRMAKEQEISLTPEEITGMCGRLRCCLNYEYEQYREGRRGLPKKGKWVETPEGVGRVTVVLPLKGTILVNIYGQGLKEFPGEDVTLTQRPQRPESNQRNYNRSSNRNTPNDTPKEEVIPEQQLKELNAETIDISNQTPPPKQNNDSKKNTRKKNFNSRHRRNKSNRNRSKGNSKQNNNNKQSNAQEKE